MLRRLRFLPFRSEYQAEDSESAEAGPEAGGTLFGVAHRRPGQGSRRSSSGDGDGGGLRNAAVATIEDGLNEQLARAGKPLQLNVTVPL